MFFLIIAIIETFSTIILGLVAISSDSFYIGGITFITLTINCIFWFALFSLWLKAKKNQEEIKVLKNALNECRSKLKLPKIQEKSIDELPTYNPFFNPYAEENGIEISDNNDDN